MEKLVKCGWCSLDKEEYELINTECNKSICLICISEYVKENLSSKIKCPVEVCDKFLRDRVIRKVLSDADIEKYEDMCLGEIKCSHTCLLKECGRKIIYTDINTQYDCPNCSLYNCVKCNFPHYFMSCEVFKSKDKADRDQLEKVQFSRARQNLFKKNKKIVQEIIESNNEIDLWPPKEIFSCSICGNDIARNNGVCLRSCLDFFCRNCLVEHVKNSDQLPITCPLCSTREICDREIYALLNDKNHLKKYRQKSLDHAKRNVRQLTNCRQPNCTGIFYIEINAKLAICTRCCNITCISCNTVHENGKTCEQYKNEMNASLSNKNIEEQIRKKELMRCPDCKTLIHRSGGCGWIQCITCGTELCWYKQTYRWGPNGCKCAIENLCHPNCGGCQADVRRMIATNNSPSNNGGSGYSESNRPGSSRPESNSWRNTLTNLLFG